MVGQDVLKDLGRLFNEGTDAGQSDGRLLERFLARRDEAAFGALVTRHGSMVLGVCRRLLRDPNDVDDAFQAVFLVLVRRCGSLRDSDRLASWLYGVAYRVSLRARATAARRRGRERPGVESLAFVSDRDLERQELLAVLDEEVTRLPEPSRAVVVLCDLDGLTHEEASHRLECPVGTVKSRLSSARARLRGRLMRRGLAPALAAAGSSLLVERATAASLTESLVLRSVRAAVPYVSRVPGVAEVGLVPATVAALVEGELATMATISWKSLAALLLVSGAAVAGAVSLARPIPVAPPKAPQSIPAPIGRASSPPVEPLQLASNAAPDRPLDLVNPGAEEGDGDLPKGWSKGAKILGVSYLWSRESAHGGEASLSLKKTEDLYFPIAQWTQTVVREGDSPRLKVSSWIKADRAGKAILDAQFLDRKGKRSHAWVAYIGAKQAGDPPVTHDWKLYEGVVEIPPGTAKVVIAPQIYGPGTAWFDDLSAAYTTDPATDPLTR